MGYVNERVAYLKGLAEGMNISDSTNEGKLFKAIIEVIDDLATEVDNMQEQHECLAEQVEEIDEDLSELESLVKYDCNDDKDCENDNEEEFLAEIHCPHCGNLVEVTDNDLNDNCYALKCESCGEEINIEWESCSECGCDDDENSECCCDGEKEKN
jgi:hypothetical protein